MRSFWLARFARVYPLHLAALVLLAGLAAVGFIQSLDRDGRCYDAWNSAASLALVHVWDTTYGLCWSVPSWSIGEEAGAGWQRVMRSDAGCLWAVAAVALSMHLGLPDVLTVGAMAMVVAGLAGNRGAPGRVFGGGTFAWLGAISYAVYTLHWPLLLVLIPVLEAWFPARETPPGEAVQAAIHAVFFSVLLAVSAAAHRLLELPARRWLRRGRGASPALQRA